MLEAEVGGDLAKQPVRHGPMVGEIVTQISECLQAHAGFPSDSDPTGVGQPCQRTNFDDVVVADSGLQGRQWKLSSSPIVRKLHVPPQREG
jgi:hypothetical protein